MDTHPRTVPLARTLLALERLELLLEPTGQRLAWHHDNYVQLATHDSVKATAGLAMRTFATDGPELPETRLLARLAEPNRKRPSVGSVRYILGRLVSAGLVDVSALPDEHVALAGRGADEPRLTELAPTTLYLADRRSRRLATQCRR